MQSDPSQEFRSRSPGVADVSEDEGDEGDEEGMSLRWMIAKFSMASILSSTDFT